MDTEYQTPGPSRAEIERIPGVATIEFGTSWCGHCKAAQPYIDAALAQFPDIARIRIEDGQGRATGRSFAVKLWPTLIVLRDGREVARVVRPTDTETVANALAATAR